MVPAVPGTTAGSHFSIRYGSSEQQRRHTVHGAGGIFSCSDEGVFVSHRVSLRLELTAAEAADTGCKTRHG